MNDFTFLTKKQVYGWKKIDIIRERGEVAEVTDFAILLGARSYTTMSGKKIGSYWTKTNRDMPNNIQVVGDRKRYKNLYFSDVRDRGYAGRPTLYFSSNKDLFEKIEIGEIIKSKKGILEVEYGNYPQTIASLEMQKQLELLYKNRSISKHRNRMCQ